MMKDELPQPTLSEITITESDVYEGLISLNPVKAMSMHQCKNTKALCLSTFQAYSPPIFVSSITVYLQNGVFT